MSVIETVHTLTSAELVARRQYPTGRNVWVFGRNLAIGAGVAEALSFNGLLNFPAAAAAMEVFSTNAADDGAPPGIGVQTVRVVGLDGAGAIQAEDVTLNGNAPVALTNTYLRINGLFALTVGTAALAAGDISVQLAGAGAIQRTIPAAMLNSTTGLYTVPAGRYAMLRGGTGYASNPVTRPALTIDANRRPVDTLDPAAIQSTRLQLITMDPVGGPISPPMRIEALTDVALRIRNGSGSVVQAGFSLGLTEHDLAL